MSATAPALPASLDYPRLKLLAVGDLGVGKSCLIKRYCEGRFIGKYIPTIGIDFGVKKTEVNRAAVLQARGTGGGEATASHIPAAVRVNFWDGSGDDDYREIRNEFYEAAQGVLLLYDVRNAQSFADLQKWWAELVQYCAGMDDVASTGGGAAVAGKRASVTSTTAAGKAVGRTDGKAPVVVLCANKVDDTASTQSTGGGAAAAAAAGAPPRPRVVTEEQGRAWAREHGCAAYYETSASTEKNVKEAIDDLVVRVVAKFM